MNDDGSSSISFRSARTGREIDRKSFPRFVVVESRRAVAINDVLADFERFNGGRATGGGECSTRALPFPAPNEKRRSRCVESSSLAAQLEAKSGKCGILDKNPEEEEGGG
jgi:hypothetical protein